MELAEISSAERLPHRNENLRAGLHQHPFIHRHEDFAVGFGFISQDAGLECGDTVESLWQQPELSLARLRDDA
jgi:hypothetical protein